MQTAQTPNPCAKIVFRTGPLRGNVLALEKDRLSIGRDQRNDVAIADSIISSFHAAVVRDDAGSYWLEDLGSKNGTFLNGERIQREELRDGDVFYLCQTGAELQFTRGEPKLPGLIESTTATFTRTRSVAKALRELLPHGGTGLSTLLHLTGVRKILDYRLEETARRERLRFALLAGAFLILCTLAISGNLWLQLRGKGTPGGVPEPVASLTPRLEPIYGSLFLSYRDSSIGEVEISNLTKEPLRGCEISFSFDGAASDFLVEPYKVLVPEIAAGGSRVVALSPKLSTAVLSDQTREVSARVALCSEGRVLSESSSGLFIHGRHVFTWEKPERIAALIDPQDPAVVEFVRCLWRHRPNTSRQEFPPPNVVGALTLLTGLADLGMRYLPDGKIPISARIDGKANDSVCFPGETLLARAGDCDDLSVLCCAVLEEADIPTAFAVGAGHVFFLFDSGIGAATLDQTPLDPATVVVRGDRVWIPVESTDFARPGSNFASAWSAAWSRVRLIHEGGVRIVDVREAHRSYQPMNPPPERATEEQIRQLASTDWGLARIQTSIDFGMSSLRRLFEENLSGRLAELESTMEAGPALEQAKGLLFVRSGLFDEARRILERALFGEQVPPDGVSLRKAAAGFGEDRLILLGDLGTCLTLGARSSADLDRAAVCAEVSVGAFPADAPHERGETMLRVALIHRLRGDLPSERAWSQRAFGEDPALRDTYQLLTAQDGTVAGPEDRILDWLRAGIDGDKGSPRAPDGATVRTPPAAAETPRPPGSTGGSSARTP